MVGMAPVVPVLAPVGVGDAAVFSALMAAAVPVVATPVAEVRVAVTNAQMAELPDGGRLTGVRADSVVPGPVPTAAAPTSQVAKVVSQRDVAAPTASTVDKLAVDEGEVISRPPSPAARMLVPVRDPARQSMRASASDREILPETLVADPVRRVDDPLPDDFQAEVRPPVVIAPPPAVAEISRPARREPTAPSRKPELTALDEVELSDRKDVAAFIVSISLPAPIPQHLAVPLTVFPVMPGAQPPVPTVSVAGPALTDAVETVPGAMPPVRKSARPEVPAQAPAMPAVAESFLAAVAAPSSFVATGAPSEAKAAPVVERLFATLERGAAAPSPVPAATAAPALVDPGPDWRLRQPDNAEIAVAMPANLASPAFPMTPLPVSGSPPDRAPVADPRTEVAVVSDRLGDVRIGIEGSAQDLKVSLGLAPLSAAILAADLPRLVADLAANGVRLQSLDISGSGHFGGQPSGGQSGAPRDGHAPPRPMFVTAPPQRRSDRYA